MRLSERVNAPGLAMDVAILDREIATFMDKHPDLATGIKKVKEDAERAAIDRGTGALDAMNEGHNAVIDQFPQLREALGIKEREEKRPRTDELP